MPAQHSEVAGQRSSVEIENATGGLLQLVRAQNETLQQIAAILGVDPDRPVPMETLPVLLERHLLMNRSAAA